MKENFKYIKKYYFKIENTDNTKYDFNELLNTFNSGISTFSGFLEIYAGEHKIDFHSQSYGKYSCEYIKISEIVKYGSMPLIEIISEGSQPRIKIKSSRSNGILSIYILVYRSNEAGS